MVRVRQGEGYKLPENLLVRFAPDAQDFYARLEKLSGGNNPTAVEILVALLEAPSPELVEALTAFQITPGELDTEAKKMPRSSAASK